MTIPLLTTKLYIPPVRPELVSRPRLIEQLEAGLAYRLTLISAPAGFGKSTLLSDWARTRPAGVAWVSLDEGDNDPARFWAYLVAALQTIHAGVGGELLAAAQPGQRPPTRASLAALINEIAAGEETWFLCPEVNGY